MAFARFFRHLCISSDLGVDKHEPLIYRRALELSGCAAEDALHVGDDPDRDWKAAAAAGLGVFRLDRPHNSLRGLLNLPITGVVGPQILAPKPELS